MKKRRGMDIRIKAFLAVFVACLTGLGGRVGYLKLAKGAEYETKAKTQQVSRYDVTTSPNRGAILDRNKQALALSTTVYNIILDVRVLVQYPTAEQEKTITALSEVLGLDLDTLKSYIELVDPEKKIPRLDTSWKVLATKQEREVKEELESRELKGLVFQKDTKRAYVAGSTGAPVIGFVRGDTSWGLEYQYNDAMSGVNGRSFITYEGTNQIVTQEVAAQDGGTCITTLDYTLQQYSEETAAAMMAEYNAENTAVLIMNPKTGEVLAMAQSPGFNANDPAGKPEKYTQEEWDALDESAQLEVLNAAWKNFCVSSTFEPGSVVKPMVMAAALEEGLITADEQFYCGGVKTVADTDIRCWYRSGHGMLSAEGVLAQSCNVGMMDIGAKMGANLLHQYLKDFGFGSRTGIDLPNEVSAASLMYSADRMGPTEIATMSFGQSFNATPIQILTAFNAVINGGKLMRPYVVSQVVDAAGSVVQENKPEVVRTVISQETSDTIREMLRSTMIEGTGKKAYLEGYSIGGKTGTAQQGNRAENVHSLSFITYLPVEDPELSVMVIIHKSEFYQDGVTSAAPAMKSLLEKIIKYKAIEPTAAVVEGLAETKKVTLDDFTGQQLGDVFVNLDYLGLEAEIVGSGNLVVNQAPHGGTVVEEGSKILLYVEKGAEEGDTVQVPDVTGKTYDEAVSALMEKGFSALFVGTTEGTVTGQEPRAGLSVAAGSDVTLTLTLSGESAPAEETPAE